MNYELALELREAGFPGTFTGECETGCNVPNEDLTDFAYCPTPEELIEACGERFVSLNLIIDPKGWSCEAVNKNEEITGEIFGATPTEAVARLWLAINKK